MKVADDHMFYGAAIIQIAEHESFTAINKYESAVFPSRCAYWVNQDIGVYLKYRYKPDQTTIVDDNDAKVHIFVFNDDTRAVLDEMGSRSSRVYIGCVCVEDRQICCISIDEYRDFFERRSEALGHEDDQFRIQVAYVPGGKFRAYVTTPNRKNVPLGGVLRIAQNAFPEKIFS